MFKKLTYCYSNVTKLNEEIRNTAKLHQTNSYVCIEDKWIENKITIVFMFMAVKLK